MGRAAEEFEREARAGLDEAFNSLIRLIATELPEVSPVYTGFFASSWQVSLSGPPAPRDEVKNFEPWAQIKREKRSRFPSFPSVIDPRFDIPRVTIKDQVYIGNTAKYARYALERPSQIVSYIAGIQKLAKTVFKPSDGLSLKASARGSSTGARYRRIV